MVSDLSPSQPMTPFKSVPLICLDGSESRIETVNGGLPGTRSLSRETRQKVDILPLLCWMKGFTNNLSSISLFPLESEEFVVCQSSLRSDFYSKGVYSSLPPFSWSVLKIRRNLMLSYLLW